MDTQARIEAAKGRLEESRQALIALKEGGPPCTKCRYFVRYEPKFWAERHPGRRWTGPRCAHPSFADHAFDPVFHKVTQASLSDPAYERKPEGSCGPEGVLFEVGRFNEATMVEAGKSAVLWGGGFFAMCGLFAVGDLLSALF